MISTIVACIGFATVIFTAGFIIGMKVADGGTNGK